ncbi:MAG: tRNA (adenosine(37)-N6)-threonylcarbamoyltransferase complex dimerization subunit type 1 TsaB [Peptococcaceae bacterium]|nr:tRNA (adenosine(37)-N6)-threonylcarbamoyltransferase complex dimerization subunit type 1 TsaB [Peptococcaceae bacterium]
MKYLTIDTTTKATAIALAELPDAAAAAEECPPPTSLFSPLNALRLVGEGFLHDQKTHSERLIPFLDALVAAVAWRLEELDFIGVVRGPGSFTGIRIGLATAQGLAKALDRPVFGVLSLDCLSWAARSLASLASDDCSPYYVATILDARKNEWYAACYRWMTLHSRVCVLPPRAVTPADFLRKLAQMEQLERIEQPRQTKQTEQTAGHHTKFLFAGDGVLNADARRLITCELGEKAVVLPPEQALPRGSYTALECAYAREMKVLPGCAPFYLRLSEAESKLLNQHMNIQ